jgi:membrane fusion protein, multidrug efflux system
MDNSLVSRTEIPRMQALSYKLITGISIFCIGLAFYFYWQYRAFYPSTDNAYVQANVVHIAAEVTGPLQALYITNNQPVHKNE